MNYDPRHLIQFARIIEAESFSLAAERLGTTQPALSSMVKNLELRAGLPLLERRRRPVTPTQLGQELANLGSSIEALLHSAEQVTQEVQNADAGLIRVAAPSFFCEFALSEMITSFWKLRPKSNFDIQTGYQRELYDMVKTRAIDMAFGPIQLDDETPLISRRTIVSLEHAVICRQGHPLLAAASVDRKDLQEARWITHSRQSVLFRTMEASLTGFGVTSMKDALNCNSASALLELIKSTDWLSVLPPLAILPLISNGTVRVLRFEGNLPQIPFGLLYHQHKSPSPLEEEFIKHVEASLLRSQAELQRFL